MFNIKITEISKEQSSSCSSFLQTPFWCNFKARHGWTYRRFNIEYTLPAPEDNECSTNKASAPKDLHKTFELAVLNRSFCKDLFSIAYIPLMPDLPFECTSDELIDNALLGDEGNFEIIAEQIITPETQAIEFANLLNEIAFALKSYLPKNTITVRFDPHVDFSNAEDRDIFNYGIKTVAYADRLKLRKSRVDIQPPDTTIADLTASEDDILSKMHSKWRYNIRLSEKKGVKIHSYLGNCDNLSTKIDKFYELTLETNARDGNSCHAKSYYLDLIKSSAEQNPSDSNRVTLYIAEHEGDEIAAIMTIFSKDEAVYLYGASSNLKRNFMPNYLLQWNAMKDAKKYGCKYYDMYGIPPAGKDENHPMHGLYMFKANFGGKMVHRTGSWDVPLKSVYFIYAIAENLRAFWHKKFLKKIRGR